MNKTKIEWCDYSWNPITGCLNNCFYCYARKMYQRFHKPFVPELHEDRLLQPNKCKEPSRIFTCSVSDFWGKGVPQKWRDKVYKIMNQCPQHTFLLLTKQPQRIRDMKKRPLNCWVGVSVSTDRDWGRSARLIIKFPDRTFISIEPLMEKGDGITSYFFLPDWIIVGAMTGVGSEKYQPSQQVIQYIIKCARRCKKPLFLKNNLNWREKIQEFPMGKCTRS